MKSPAVFTCVLGGVALGFFVGHGRAARESDQTAKSLAPNARSAAMPVTETSTDRDHADLLIAHKYTSEADRRAALRVALLAASPLELQTILRNIAAAPPGLSRELNLRTVFEIWGRSDPTAALAKAQELGDRALTQALTTAVLKGWALRDPVAAWAQATMSNAAPENALAVLTSLAASDPERAWQWAENLSHADTARRQEACWSVVAALSRAGEYERSLALISQTSDDELRSTLTARLAENWARYDPASASTWALGRAPDAAPSGVAWKVAHGWAERDAPEAAEFARQLPAGAVRKEMLAGAVGEWSRQDAAAASAWLREMPSAVENDPALVALATNPIFATRYPDTAMQWAERITGSETRGETIQAIGLRWATVDFAAAERYLEQTPALTAAQRALALAVLPLREMREGQ